MMIPTYLETLNLCQTRHPPPMNRFNWMDRGPPLQFPLAYRPLPIG